MTRRHGLVKLSTLLARGELAARWTRKPRQNPPPPEEPTAPHDEAWLAARRAELHSQALELERKKKTP